MIAVLPAWWFRQAQVELWSRILIPTISYVVTYGVVLVTLGLESEDRMLLGRLLQRWRRSAEAKAIDSN
jgi:hypothetical protein